MAVTALSSPNQDLTARVGLLKGDAEVFVTGKYESADAVEWDELTPDQMGAGVLLHLTQDISIEDTPAYAPVIGPILEALHARPYAGFEVVGDIGNGASRHFQPNIILGTTFTIAPASNIGLVVEFVTGDAIETDEVYIGGRLRF
jgi:hypothetical protein